jgi:hypothetical protein
MVSWRLQGLVVSGVLVSVVNELPSRKKNLAEPPHYGGTALEPTGVWPEPVFAYKF